MQELPITPYERFRSVKYFGSLDGLRCASIVGVIWHHACADRYARCWALNPLQMGYIGVDLFFVISGFLITTLLLRERERCGQISLRLFYARRSLRIFPLYFSVLALWVLAVAVMEPTSPSGVAFWHNLPYFVTYTSNLFVTAPPGARVIFVFAWSLAAEEQFYFFWPAMVRLAGRAWLAVIACGLILLDQVFTLRAVVLPSMLHRVVTSIATPIALGVLVALLLHSCNGYAMARRLLGWRWASAGMLVLVLAALYAPLVPESRFRDALSVPLALLVAACVIREDHILAGAMKWRPAAGLGVISYGMYLMHMVGIHAADKALHAAHLGMPWLRFLIALPLTGGLAALSYRYYESSFLRLKSRFARELAPVAESARPQAPLAVVVDA